MKPKSSALLVLLCVAQVANADPVESPSLSLADCLSRAQSFATLAKQSSIQERGARGALSEATARLLPQVSAQFAALRSYDIIDQSPDATRAVVHVEQTAYPGSAQFRTREQRELEYSAARATSAETGQELALQVKQLYLALLRDQDSVDRYRKVEGEWKQLLLAVAPRFTIGKVPPFDQTKVRVSLLDLTRARETLETQMAGERASLSQLLGWAPESVWVPKPLKSLPQLPELPSGEAAFRNNPTLQAGQLGAEAARKAVSVTRSARMPTLNAFVDYGFEGKSPDQVFFPGWTASATITLPLFDWGALKSASSQAQAQAELAEVKVRLAREQISTDSVRIFSEAKSRRADRERLRVILDEVDRSARVSVDRYRRGAAGIIEVTDAVNLWLQTLINERTAYYGYWSDLAQLERLAGGAVQVNYE